MKGYYTTCKTKKYVYQLKLCSGLKKKKISLIDFYSDNLNFEEVDELIILAVNKIEQLTKEIESLTK